MGESLMTKIVFQENQIELTRQELREVARTGDYAEIGRIADRLGDELKALAALRERAAATTYRNLAKEVAAQLLRMAKAKPDAQRNTRAIAADPKLQPLEIEEADHAAGLN